MFQVHFRLKRSYVALMAARQIAAKNRHSDRHFLARCRSISQTTRLSTTNLALLPKGYQVLHHLQRDLKFVEHHPEIGKILDESRDFRVQVQKQWTQNRTRIATELAAILRIPLPKDDVNVFTAHPSLNIGYAVPQLRAICWGHKEDFQNYHSVYITHELLHLILPPDAREVDHALIELIADNELRIRLNGNGRYFQYPGHRYLLPLEKTLMPHWQRYLHRRSGSIWSLLRRCQKVV